MCIDNYSSHDCINTEFTVRDGFTNSKAPWRLQDSMERIVQEGEGSVLGGEGGAELEGGSEGSKREVDESGEGEQEVLKRRRLRGERGQEVQAGDLGGREREGGKKEGEGGR